MSRGRQKSRSHYDYCS